MDSQDFSPQRDSTLHRSAEEPFEAGDGSAHPHASHGADAYRSSAEVLVSGETGVQFGALVLFAEPLFETYDLDMADAFALKSAPDAAAPDVLAVLETARLFWAFFSLSPSERAHKRSALAAQLHGGDPSEDEWIDIEALLNVVEPHWQAMLEDEIAQAQDTGHTTLDLDALLRHPTWQLHDTAEALAYGPNALSDIEARALFAQPLLEDPTVLLDEKLFDEAVERASAFWTVALTPKGDRDEALQKVISRFSGPERDPEAVAEEATMMIQRFATLFPERQS